MTRNAWAHRGAPPLIIAIVIACVWYAVESRPSPQAASPTSGESASTPHADAPQTVANDSVLPAISPTVQSAGENVQFSIAHVPLKNIQRVEFYIESQFVGTAYSQPYIVAVSENSLSNGNHTVIARIYTAQATVQSKPATFTAKPSQPAVPPIDSGESKDVVATPSPTTAAPPATPTLDAPYNLASTVGGDGSSVTITWSAPASAVRYSIWRDGVSIATTTGTGFTDTGLTAGQTYDYQAVAVDAAGNSSAPSVTIAVTLPANSGVATPGTSAPTDQTDSRPVSNQN